jgi:hypothetical protein
MGTAQDCFQVFYDAELAETDPDAEAQASFDPL